MKLKIQHLKNIIAANNDNRLAIFVGAGVSKNSETTGLKLPTWPELIADLKKDLELTDETDYLKIAQLYYLEFKEHSYLKKIKDYFPDNIRPSIIHKQIFELNPQIIITTNWDNILEKAIEENAYIYDVIRCDEDLVKSTLQKKVIKMHGDFKTNNIVFKEDDYLNYQYNFPLIENYVKSILSTHTILFLGYSYNDINFKHITKWLQNYSKVQPPRYLTVFEENTTQNKYLENHGINIYPLEEPNKKMITQKDYFENTKYFLDLIKNKEKVELLNTKNDSIAFVLNKLKILTELNGILLEQIQNSLTNCGFIYDNNKIILEFYERRLTYNIDTEKRKVYKDFVEILKRQSDEKLSNSSIVSIFEILKKANIQGIVITDDNINTVEKEYIVIDEYLKDDVNNLETIYYNFDFTPKNNSKNDLYELLNSSFLSYQVEDYEGALEIIEKTILQCLRLRNYSILFISMFNKNVLIKHLKHKDRTNKNYKNIEEYNLEDKLYELPKDLQKALKPIYNFLNASYLYKFAYEISRELNDKEKSKKTIESGGYVFDSNASKSFCKHKNFISFILRNRIMVEDFSEVKSINNYFLQIALIRQIQQEKTTFDQMELFSAIKYLTNNELSSLLNDFYKYDSLLKGKFEISDTNKQWLIKDVFANIVKYYVESKSVSNSFNHYLKNSILLLSLSQLTDDEMTQIIVHLNTIIGKTKNTIDIYQSINLFFGNQYNLFKTSINQGLLLELITSIISKIVYRQYSGHDFHAITRNRIANIYYYAQVKNAIFKDELLIDKLISSSTELSIEDQLHISESLLLSIYNIASEQVKEKIKQYILSIKSIETKEKHDYLIFELVLIIRDFKIIDKTLLEELSDYIEQFKTSSTFSTILYTLEGQIDYLIREKKLNQLETISKTIKDFIDSYNKRKTLSVF